MKKIKRNLAPIFSITFGLAICLSILAYAETNTENILQYPPLGITGHQILDENAAGASITNLLTDGEVTTNNGYIETVSGNVTTNNGTIKNVYGHVGTNKGQIEGGILVNGSLGENDTTGVVAKNDNTITRNDGTVTLNINTIENNYGTVNENAVNGTVTMHDGSIGTNAGTVYIENAGSELNPIIIGTNTGEINISNSYVSVTSNEGTINISGNTHLECTTNETTGVINKDPLSSATYSVTTDNGLINDGLVKIEVTGDDGNLVIVVCEAEIDSVPYTKQGGSIMFTLPSEYGCKDASVYSLNEALQFVTPNLENGQTVFTLECHKHDFEWAQDITNLNHWKICEGCGDTKYELEEHTWKWVSDGNATYEEDGTKHEECSKCGYTKASVPDVESKLTRSSHKRLNKSSDKKDEVKKDEPKIEEPKVEEIKTEILDDKKENEVKPVEEIKPVSKVEEVKPVEIKKQKPIIKEEINEALSKEEINEVQENNESENELEIEEEIKDEEIDNEIIEEESSSHLPIILTIIITSIAVISLIAVLLKRK